MKTKSGKGMNGVTTAGRQTTADERYRMIAEAAYFRALGRNFEGGDVVDDWCCAEREVDVMLLSDATAAPAKKTGGKRASVRTHGNGTSESQASSNK